MVSPGINDLIYSLTDKSRLSHLRLNEVDCESWAHINWRQLLWTPCLNPVFAYFLIYVVMFC